MFIAFKRFESIYVGEVISDTGLHFVVDLGFPSNESVKKSEVISEVLAPKFSFGETVKVLFKYSNGNTDILYTGKVATIRRPYADRPYLYQLFGPGNDCGFVAYENELQEIEPVEDYCN